MRIERERREGWEVRDVRKNPRRRGHRGREARGGGIDGGEVKEEKVVCGAACSATEGGTTWKVFELLGTIGGDVVAVES